MIVKELYNKTERSCCVGSFSFAENQQYRLTKPKRVSKQNHENVMVRRNRTKRRGEVSLHSP